MADAARLGYSLTAGEEEALLARASARIRREAGQQISSITSTVTLDVHGGRVLLPGGPVTAVASVAHTAADGGAAITGWRWNGYDKVYQLPPCAQQVAVTYTHGFVTVPDELVELVCSVAQRLGTSDGATGMEAGIRSESIDDYSVTYASEAREDASSLLPGEVQSLRSVLGTPTAFVVSPK
ncbi:hypothetical protein IMZ11_02335 [Microtetraspora sp. AC03309]|uniref:hypothetical protein n=1 Tax=Microtetraspora sp. AC03309 TaxID=2779376 RepID=UPI001E59C8C4|nr:hypothetical protein [Microtetraspora sp. AC03309]MCC5574479.1 hypothetical protein [Microtetraspora sp. AC03309]